MYWEYIGVGVGVLAIGIALVVGVPPPGWPKMPRGFVRATITVGILVGIIGLYLMAIGLSPALKDQTKWPQIGMIIFAMGFIGCAVWYWSVRPLATTATPNQTNSLDNTIGFECAWSAPPRAELVHLDATLRLFDPYIQPDEIASRKRWPRRTEYFARGELTRLVFESIREHGSTAAGELAAAAMLARSIPESDNAIRRDFVARFLNTLHDLLRRGSVEKIGQGRGVRWKLADRQIGELFAINQNLSS